MALVEHLIAKIPDAALRKAIEREVTDPKKRLTWGLVFERHIAETTLLLDAPVRPGSVAWKRQGSKAASLPGPGSRGHGTGGSPRGRGRGGAGSVGPDAARQAGATASCRPWRPSATRRGGHVTTRDPEMDRRKDVLRAEINRRLEQEIEREPLFARRWQLD